MNCPGCSRRMWDGAFSFDCNWCFVEFRLTTAKWIVRSGLSWNGYGSIFHAKEDVERFLKLRSFE